MGRDACVQIPPRREVRRLAHGDGVVPTQPHGSHRGADASAWGAQKPGVQTQAIRHGLCAQVAHQHLLVQPAGHQAEGLHGLVVIGVALEAVRAQRHLQRVVPDLAPIPGLQPTIAVDGIRLASPVGLHRVELAALRKATAADAVGPGHHGKRCHLVQVCRSAIPGAPKVQPTFGAGGMVHLPGGDAAAQGGHQAQVLVGMAQPDDGVGGGVGCRGHERSVFQSRMCAERAQHERRVACA